MADATPLTQRMARVIRQDVQSTHGYAIQPSAGLIKLDAMENPFRLPERLQRALGERLARVAINRYPVQCAVDVAAALSRHVDLPTGCKLMLGNGSGARIAAPFTLQAADSMSISSSEPLPSISLQPVGSSTWRDSAAATSTAHCTG